VSSYQEQAQAEMYDAIATQDHGRDRFAEQHEARRTKGARVVVVADDWRGRREYPATVAIPLGEARIARYRGKIGVKYDTGGFAWVHEYEVWSHD